MTGVFPEPLAFSARAARELKPRAGEFDLVHDNQCLGYGIAKLELAIKPEGSDREPDQAKERHTTSAECFAAAAQSGKVAGLLQRHAAVSSRT